MKIFKTVHELQAWRQGLKSLGFVPTMGALHQGHLSLVQRCREECDKSLVSIFVNPTQFNDPNDFANYPKSLDEDLNLLKEAGVDAVFLPTDKELYPQGHQFQISEKNKSSVLCGPRRPGHFEGVMTVMMKLLMLSGCQKCFMGEKDFQQLSIIQDMAKDFFLPVEIVGVPTMREADGLAMSSRNRLLSPGAREIAPLLYKRLCKKGSLDEAQRSLEKAGFEVEYLEEYWGRRFVAAKIDGVRLIDNV